MNEIKIEMNAAEALTALGVISDKALEHSRIAAFATGDEREILDLSSRMLTRVATAITDALYPTCAAWYSEGPRCDRPAEIGGYCAPHARATA